MKDLKSHIEARPDICHGKVCIKGTRVMASIILDNLAAGVSEDEIIRNYPSVTKDDIQACLLYASELIKQK